MPRTWTNALLRYDMTGQRHGAWTVLRRDMASVGKVVKWICQCDCGSPERSVVGITLRKGLSTRCSDCRKVPDEVKREKWRAYHREWAKKNRAKLRAAGKRYAERHPDRLRAKAMRRRQDHPDYYITERARRYGLTLDEYRRIESAQGGVCALCTRPAVSKSLHIDHCHESGVVRGLLCERCNMALGLFDDNAERLARAAAYVAKHQAGKKSA